MNTCCNVRSSRPAGPFSFGLLDRLQICLRRPHLRETPAGFGLWRFATAFTNNPGWARAGEVAVSGAFWHTPISAIGGPIQGRTDATGRGSRMFTRNARHSRYMPLCTGLLAGLLGAGCASWPIAPEKIVREARATADCLAPPRAGIWRPPPARANPTHQP